MPFGYSREIFKYPAVQYIPLERYQEKIGRYYDFKNVHINIFDYTEEEKLLKKISSLGITSYEIQEDQLALLIVNGKINLIQYRGYEVIMVGKKSPGDYHLFKITTEYFYKDRLIFLFYEGKTAEKLDWESYKLT